MLAPILESTRQRIERLPPVVELEARAGDAPPVRPFGDALVSDRLSVIAEIKRRSPSRGELSADLDPIGQARAYQRGGASAISVLTEPFHFSGSSEDLVAVRRAVEIPVLRKDFTLVPEQIWEARSLGADAVLLIVAALDDDDLRQLLDTATSAGMAALVEVHDEPETYRALEAGAQIVGVNNRDLTTFEVDLGTAERLAPLLSGTPVTVGESGVHTRADALRMAAASYDAVLIGESLLRSPDPAGLLDELRV